MTLKYDVREIQQ